VVPYGYESECMASALCVYELLVENYGKHLANAKRSTPLSESRARNLSSPVFVVWQQYGACDVLDHVIAEAFGFE
jgi:neutral trehalase